MLAFLQCVCAVPSMTFFCIFLTSCFPGILLRYLMNDREMVSLVPVITGITFVFTFHIHCICVVRSLYFKILSSFLFMFIPPEISVFTSRHVRFSLPRIMVTSLLLETVLSVCTSSFYNMASLFALVVSTGFRACSYRCSLCNFTPNACMW
jgi:hypothetical protein